MRVLCCLLLATAGAMLLTEGLDLLHSLSDTVAMESALQTLVREPVNKSCSSLDGPICLTLGVGPEGVSRLLSLLSSVGWSVQDLKARMSEEEVVAVLLAWWHGGSSEFTKELRKIGATELAAQVAERLKS